MSDADSTTPSPRRGRNASSDGSSRAAIAHRAPAGVALGVEEVVVERRGGEDLSLLGGDRLEDPGVDVAQGLGDVLTLGAGNQSRNLQQLEIPHDRMRDVEVGVEAQLPEPPGGPHRALEQLVAEQPIGRVERLRRTEQLLFLVLPRETERRPRRLHERERKDLVAAVSKRRVAQHDPLSRSCDPDVQRLAQPSLPARLVVGGHHRGVGQQRVRHRLRPGHAHPAVQADHEHVRGLEPAGPIEPDHLDRARAAHDRLLLFTQAEVGDRRDRARKLARRRERLAPHVGRRELAEPGERPQPLDDVRLSGEQLLAAQPESIDQPVHVEVRTGRVDRCRPGAIELEEHQDPLARLGRDLGRFRRRCEGGDHVELAPARDLRAARDVDRPQLDRRTGERADDRRGVRGISEQAQPREHVADLCPLEERRLPDQPVRYGPLLKRDRHRLPLTRDLRDKHRDLAWGDALTSEQALDLRGHRLRLGAIVRRPPERDRPTPRRRPRHRRAEQGPGNARDLHRATKGTLQAPHREARQRLERSERCDARSAEPPQGRSDVGGDRQPVGRRAGDGAHEPSRDELEFLGVIDEHMAEAPADRGMIGGRAQRVAHEVALVPGPRVREHSFVGAIHLRELLLEGRLSLRDTESRGPFGVGLGVDQLRLAAVDPTHERAEQSVDATPEVVVLHRELVDPLDQHRQPVAGAQRRGVKVALGRPRQSRAPMRRGPPGSARAAPRNPAPAGPRAAPGWHRRVPPKERGRVRARAARRHRPAGRTALRSSSSSRSPRTRG